MKPTEALHTQSTSYLDNKPSGPLETRHQGFSPLVLDGSYSGLAITKAGAALSQRTFSEYVRQELFGSFLSGILTVGEIIGVFALGFTAVTVVREISAGWPGHREFALYIYLTYAATVILFGLWVSIARKVRVDLEEASETARRKNCEAVEERGRMAEIQHRMAEVVRKYAVKCSKGGAVGDLESDKDVQDVFDLVRRFLEKKLNRSDIAIAIKFAKKGAGPERRPDELEAVFRKVPDNPNKANRTNTIPLDDSVVYQSFEKSNDSLRRIVIRDVERLPTGPEVGNELAERNRAYRLYAQKCGFRSVVAFPLRAPPLEKTRVIANYVRGFLSFDSPEPDAFDGLFESPDPAEGEIQNDGSNLGERLDMHLFFGISDGLATLAMLQEEVRLAQNEPVVGENA